jgi:hypothetical protein
VHRLVEGPGRPSILKSLSNLSKDGALFSWPYSASAQLVATTPPRATCHFVTALQEGRRTAYPVPRPPSLLRLAALQPGCAAGEHPRRARPQLADGHQGDLCRRGRGRDAGRCRQARLPLRRAERRVTLGYEWGYGRAAEQPGRPLSTSRETRSPGQMGSAWASGCARSEGFEPPTF